MGEGAHRWRASLPASRKKTKPSPPLGERVRVRGLSKVLSAKAVRIQTNVGATRRVAPTDLGLFRGDTQVAPYPSDGFLHPSPPCEGERVRVRGFVGARHCRAPTVRVACKRRQPAWLFGEGEVI
jgi:hypothetical protein